MLTAQTERAGGTIADPMNAQQLWFALYDGCIGLRLDGDALEILAEPGQLTPPLMAAIRAHKADLLEEAAKLTRLRTEFTTLHEWIIQLRFRNPVALPRAEMIARLSARIDALAPLCGLPDGYSDPGDPFSSDALAILRSEFEELTATDLYPMPLPADCRILPEADFDVFGRARRFNGKPIRRARVGVQDAGHRRR